MTAVERGGRPANGTSSRRIRPATFIDKVGIKLDWFNRSSLETAGQSVARPTDSSLAAVSLF
jgi:hypothetical protein